MDLNAVLGGMLGLAAGDALGVPVEFMSRASLEKIPSRICGPLERTTSRQAPGQTTPLWPCASWTV